MTDGLASGLAGGAISLAILFGEVAVIFSVRRAHARVGTEVALVAFGVAFLLRVVLLLAAKLFRAVGLNDELAFGVGVAGGLLVGLVVEVVLFTKKFDSRKA